MIHRITRTVAAVTLAIAALDCAQAEGLYIGGNIGSPNYMSSINGIGGGDSGLGLKFYGGYELTPNFAVEGGLFSLGQINGTNSYANSRGAYVEGVGSYQFAPSLSVLGSAGLAQGYFTTTLGNDWSAGVKLGVGLQYDLTRQTALRMQYEHYHFVNAFDTAPNIGEYSFGVKLRF